MCAAAASLDTNVNRTWLQRQIARECGDGPVSVQDMCVAVFEALDSPASDDALQFTLFELLGEKFARSWNCIGR